MKPASQGNAARSSELLDRIETALQRAPVMCASPATWVAEEGEPAMAALRELRFDLEFVPNCDTEGL